MEERVWNVSTVATSAVKKRGRAKPERRKALRHLVLKKFAVVLYPHDKETDAPEALGSGVVTDLTAFGAGLILDQIVRVGRSVLLMIEAGSQHLGPFVGTVKWVGPLPTMGHIVKSDSDCEQFFRVGLALKLTDDERRLLALPP